MRDADFEVFIDEFGEATHRMDVRVAALEKWHGKLPDRLLTCWKDEGWAGYANGLIWIVDPDEYEDLVDEWLEDSQLEQLDAFHVIARTAFGKLFLWGEVSGQSVTINCATHAMFALQSELKEKSAQDLDISMRSFLCRSKGECDLKDESRIRLFDRAVKKLGPIGPDEMYGFEPAIVGGGKMQLENLRVVKLDQHLTILRQLAAPTMPFSNIDIEKLITRK